MHVALRHKCFYASFLTIQLDERKQHETAWRQSQYSIAIIVNVVF